MTRSYGNTGTSMAGAAVIIGLRTGKILFAGVRNKNCDTCKKLLKQGKEPVLKVVLKIGVVILRLQAWKQILLHRVS